MIHKRQPAVAAALEHLENPGTPCLQAVASAARDLTGVGGFEPPSWRELMTGARPEPREPEDFEPGTTRDGWQHEAASHVEEAEPVPKDVRLRFQKSLDEVSMRAWRWSSTVDMPCQSTDHVHFTAFLGRLTASFAPSSSPYRAQLLLWPST